MEHAIGKLAKAGIDQARIRTWARDIADEFGVTHYILPALDRIMARATKPAAPEDFEPCR